MLKIFLDVRSTIMSTTGLYITDFSTYPNYPEGLIHYSPDMGEADNTLKPSPEVVEGVAPSTSPLSMRITPTLSSPWSLDPSTSTRHLWREMQRASLKSIQRRSQPELQQIHRRQ
jgi:hypothetical protein